MWLIVKYRLAIRKHIADKRQIAALWAHSSSCWVRYRWSRILADDENVDAFTRIISTRHINCYWQSVAYRCRSRINFEVFDTALSLSAVIGGTGGGQWGLISVQHCLLLLADFCQLVNCWKTAHVLQPYLPDQTNISYCLRTRPHNMTMISKTKFLNNTDFIIRMLYKYSY